MAEQFREVARNPSNRDDRVAGRGFDAFKRGAGDLIAQNLVTPLFNYAERFQTNTVMATPNKYAIMNTSSQYKIVQLPPVADYKGAIVWVKRAAGVGVEVNTNDGSKIDGEDSYRIWRDEGSLGMLSDGSNWHIVSHNRVGAAHDIWGYKSVSCTSSHSWGAHSIKKVRFTGGGGGTLELPESERTMFGSVIHVWTHPSSTTFYLSPWTGMNIDQGSSDIEVNVVGSVKSYFVDEDDYWLIGEYVP